MLLPPPQSPQGDPELSRSGCAVALNGHVSLRCGKVDNARKLLHTGMHWRKQNHMLGEGGGVEEEDQMEGYRLQRRVKHLGRAWKEAVSTNRGAVERKHSLL